MKPKTYLSVDLDFFMDPPDFDKLFRGHTPHTVHHHEQMLPHIEKFSPVDVLLNLDAHDDLVHTPDSLHCGSWVEYAADYGISEYHWVSPHIEPWRGRSCRRSLRRKSEPAPPYGKPVTSGWEFKRYRQRFLRDTPTQMTRLYRLLDEYDIIACGVAISLLYLPNTKVLPRYKEWLATKDG